MGQKWGEAIHKKYGNMDIEEICKWAEQFLKDLQERVGPEQASQTMRIMMESEQERKEIGWFKCVLQFYEDITDVLGGVQAKQTAEVRMRMLEEGEEAGWLSGDVQKEVPWTEDWSADGLLKSADFGGGVLEVFAAKVCHIIVILPTTPVL